MKKTVIPVLVVLIVTGFTACQKSGGDSTPVLEATKTTAIKKGEPVVFKITNTPNAGATIWEVTPAANVQINSSGNAASILFARSGSFTVLARSGNISAARNVTVQDSVYNLGGGGGGTPGFTTVPLTGDQLKLTPSRIDSGSNSGLVITATTTNAYSCLNNWLISSFSASASGYKIDFQGVGVPNATNCASGQTKASSFSYLYPVANGNHAFTVTLNGVTYNGTVVKSGATFTFTWPYTSGVTISPLTL